MRLLYYDEAGNLSLTPDFPNDASIPPYAILSHTWGQPTEEVTFEDITTGKDVTGSNTSSMKDNEAGLLKLRFCGDQAKKDGLSYFWVDTCCINRANLVELSEAITSMFRWYRNAVKCYVYLTDVQTSGDDEDDDNENENEKDYSAPQHQKVWMPAFRKSRWFTRGWTLQELIAPTSVEFFSQQGVRLGDKQMLEQEIHEITGLPMSVLHGTPLNRFSIEERMSWACNRQTTKEEDGAYCLIGIFDISMPLIYGEREKAFVRLKAEVEKYQTVPSSDRVNVHWTLTRSPNPFFTGRQDILDKLEAIIRASVQLNPPHVQCRIVISGIGGQGKTEISVQLAHRVQFLLWSVFWVDLSATSTAKSDFMRIANRLNVPAQTWEDGRQALANIHRPWMLILDNADDPTVDYGDFIPSGAFGVVVLTSRSKECEQYADDEHCVALEGLPTVDGQQLLLKAAQGSKKGQQATTGASNATDANDDAYEVANLLHFHPLALIQAGAYIRNGYCTLAQYPKEYQRHRKRLLEFQRSQAKSRYQHVYATFEASIEILQAMDTESAHDALDLLSVLAVCAPNQVPLWLFEYSWSGLQKIPKQSIPNKRLRLTKWHVSRMPAFMQPEAPAWDSFRLTQAVNLLSSVAIVSTSVRDSETSVSMHPLIHAWARDRQTDQEQHESWVRMGCVIAPYWAEPQFAFLHKWQLLSHIQAVISWDMRIIFGKDSKEIKNTATTKNTLLSVFERFGLTTSEPTEDDMVIYILKQCGWLLKWNEDTASLSVLLDRMFTYLGMDDSTVTERYSDLYHLVGANFKAQGKLKETIKVLEPIYQIYERVLAKDDNDRMSLAQQLFSAYVGNGQTEEADRVQEYLTEVLKTHKIMGESHPLLSESVLAGVDLELGKWDEVIRRLEPLAREWPQILPEDHPHRIQAETCLALAYVQSDRPDDGLPLLEHLVKVQERLPGEGIASSRATFMGLMGSLYFTRNEIEKAREFQEEPVLYKERVTPADDLGLLNAQAFLSSLLWMTGKKQAAFERLTRVVELVRTVQDENGSQRQMWERSLAQFTAELYPVNPAPAGDVASDMVSETVRGHENGGESATVTATETATENETEAA